MNNKTFKKHVYVLLTIFLTFLIILLTGNQDSVNVIYYLLPIGTAYALYVSISKMRYDKKMGNVTNWFTDISARIVIIETIAIAAGIFLLLQLLKLLSITKELVFNESLIEDLFISLISSFVGLIIPKLVLKLIANRKNGESSSIKS
ncbi:MAG: hypothetical protein P1U56_25475 [Saprospiraceae bacterium]|nr:hypothetical protein [Saprospiraceae bacterium]